MGYAAVSLNLAGFAVLALGVLACWRTLWNGGSGRRALGGGLVATGGGVASLGGLAGVSGWAVLVPWGLAIGVLTAAAGGYLMLRSDRWVALAGEPLAQRRQAVLAKSGPLGGAALVVALLGMPAVAWVSGIEGEAQHVFTASLPTDNKGAYLIAEQGVMQLYTWYAEPPEFPGDAPTLQTGDVKRIAVVQKQFDEIGKYVLRNLTTGEQLQWLSWDREGTQLFLDPLLPLAPGDYKFVRSTDSPYGEDTIHYFRLR